MTALKAQVHFRNGEVKDCEILAWHVVEWEQAYKSTISKLADGMGLTDIAYLAFVSLDPKEINQKAFKEWLKTVSNVVPMAAENPTVGKD